MSKSIMVKYIRFFWSQAQFQSGRFNLALHRETSHFAVPTVTTTLSLSIEPQQWNSPRRLVQRPISCAHQGPILQSEGTIRYSHLPQSECNVKNRHITVDQTFGGETRIRSDPTASPPTPNCDPYGLEGRSLSLEKCMSLISTLDDGWKVTDELEFEIDSNDNDNVDVQPGTGTRLDNRAPTYLQRHYYHETFYAASRFLTHVSLLAVNINHYPQLSLERVLVDDMRKFSSKNDDHDARYDISSDEDNDDKRTKIKGWVCVSTVRCSTFRPTKRNKGSFRDEGTSPESKMEKGLTYHDFHLAMSIDVEAGRVEVNQWLWKLNNE